MISHRGTFGWRGGVYRLDGLLEAGTLAFETRFKTIELDTVADAKGKMISVYDWNRFGNLMGRGLWSDIDFEALPNHEKRYVLRKIIHGQLLSIVKPMGTYILTGYQYLQEQILSRPGMSILLDTREKEPAFAIAELSYDVDFH